MNMDIKQATPNAHLLGNLMNPNYPKNETEWCAYHEITRLQSLIADMQKIDDVMMGENERDAKRYRWLRIADSAQMDLINQSYGDELDTAIDEAMRGEV